MDGHDDAGRQSSLPSSLIPHLYRHPPLRHYDPDAPAPLRRLHWRIGLGDSLPDDPSRGPATGRA